MSKYILLINPSAVSYDVISLGYICACLRQNGFDSDVLDMSNRVSPQMLETIVSRKNPFLIGIATYQSTMTDVLVLAAYIKERCGAKIILGGPQIPGMPDGGLAEMKDVDFLCRGEGEAVTLDLAMALDQNRDLSGVAGISYRLPTGKIKTNGNKPLVGELDDYPSPYLTGVLRPRCDQIPFLSTSRGCPYSCTFCVTPFMSRHTIRFHSPARVFDEIQYLYRLGKKDFWIVDPVFLAGKKQAKEIFRMIIRSGFKVGLNFETRANLIDDEIIELMKWVGVHYIMLGMESSNQKTLDMMNKRQKASDFAKTAFKLKKNGFKVELLHLIGAPGDDYNSIISNFDFVRRFGNLFTGYSTGNRYQLYFGSDMSIRREKREIVLNPSSGHRTKSSSHPAYLSCGTNFRLKTLSDHQRKMIMLRRSSEMRLAKIIRMFEMMKKQGFSESEVVRLPFEKIEALSGVCRQGRAAKEVLDSYDVLFIYHLIKEKVQEKLSGSTFQSVLSRLNYECRINLLDGKDCLLLNRQLVAELNEYFRKHPLYRCWVRFNINLSCWDKQRGAVISGLKQFIMERESQTQNPLTRITALLDVTDCTRQLLHNTTHRVEEDLRALGIQAHPFFRFDNKDSIPVFKNMMASLSKNSGYKHLVFVGIADVIRIRGLLHLYQTSTDGLCYPPLMMLDDDWLFIHKKGRTGQRAFKFRYSDRRRTVNATAFDVV
ncbi:MAG: B12-binding domain-containing radical SAM protein [Deltaproteobacteria bacterium]|nr:B12-binding domain-containing radical SAM protein [Deltaproteobacteria bacterium]